nr:MAG TPA_asm: hypothetical protein [Bacteriophage sp.]
MLNSPVLHAQNAVLTVHTAIKRYFTIINFFIISSFLDMIHTLQRIIQPNASQLFVCHFLADRRAHSQPTLFLCVSFR